MTVKPKMESHITDLILNEVDQAINGMVYEIRDRIELDIDHVGRSVIDNIISERRTYIGDLFCGAEE